MVAKFNKFRNFYGQATGNTSKDDVGGIENKVQQNVANKFTEGAVALDSKTNDVSRETELGTLKDLFRPSGFGAPVAYAPTKPENPRKPTSKALGDAAGQQQKVIDKFDTQVKNYTGSIEDRSTKNLGITNKYLGDAEARSGVMGRVANKNEFEQQAFDINALLSDPSKKTTYAGLLSQMYKNYDPRLAGLDSNILQGQIAEAQNNVVDVNENLARSQSANDASRGALGQTIRDGRTNLTDASIAGAKELSDLKAGFNTTRTGMASNKTDLENRALSAGTAERDAKTLADNKGKRELSDFKGAAFETNPALYSEHPQRLADTISKDGSKVRADINRAVKSLKESDGQNPHLRKYLQDVYKALDRAFEWVNYKRFPGGQGRFRELQALIKASIGIQGIPTEVDG